MVFLILFFHLFLSLFSPSWGLVPVFSLFARCHFFFFFFTNELYFLSISFLYFASLSFHCSLQAKSVNFHWLFLSWYDFFSPFSFHWSFFLFICSSFLHVFDQSFFSFFFRQIFLHPHHIFQIFSLALIYTTIFDSTPFSKLLCSSFFF